VTSAPRDGRGREILFEFVTLGQQVRVAAVDAATGTEAIVIGPAGAARADLERLAVNKLLYLLSGGGGHAGGGQPGDGQPADGRVGEARGGDGGARHGDGPASPASGGRGRIV
jgi:hypothetical protein